MKRNRVMVNDQTGNPYSVFDDSNNENRQAPQRNYQHEIQMRNIPTGVPAQFSATSFPVQGMPQYIPTYPPHSMTNLNFANNCSESTAIVCHNCKTLVRTLVDKQPGKIAIIWSAILGFSCGLCCIPFFCNRCLDKVHYCPKCGIECGKKHATFL